MKRTIFMTIVAAACTAILAMPLGCGSSSPGYQPDTQTDTVVDWDLPLDTIPGDTWPDMMDVPPDYVPDGWTDTLDVPPDTWFDTGHDTMPDPLTDTGTDIAPDGVPGGLVGAACLSAAQCTGVPGSGRTCLTSMMGMLEFPNGYCSATCTSAADCGTGGACVSIYSYGSYCLKLCSSPSQCRTADSYTCASLPGSTGSTYCLPPMPTPDGTPIDY